MYFFNRMKKSLYYILCLAFMAGACMQDQTNPMIIGTCYDGIKNQDEKAIDCGGTCQSCLTAPCTKSLEDYVLIYNGSNYQLYNNQYQASYNGTAYVFDAIVGQYQELHVSLGGPTPTDEKIYPIVKTLKDGYATVVFQDDSYNRTYTASTGSVYVTIRKGKVTIELCSVVTTSSQYQATFSGRIIAP